MYVVGAGGLVFSTIASAVREAERRIYGGICLRSVVAIYEKQGVCVGVVLCGFFILSFFFLRACVCELVKGKHADH